MFEVAMGLPPQRALWLHAKLHFDGLLDEH